MSLLPKRSRVRTSRRALAKGAVFCAALSALALPGTAAAWQESAYSQLNQRLAGAPDGTVVYARGAGFGDCGCTALVIVRPDDSRKEITWKTPGAAIPFVAVNNKVITVAWDTGNQENARVFTRTFKLDGTAIGANTRVTPPREGPKNYFAVVGLAAAGGRTVLLTSTFLSLAPQPLHASMRRGSRAFSRARTIEGGGDAGDAEVERRFVVLPDGSALLAFENRTIRRLPPDSTVWRKYKGREADTNATLHAADDGSWALGGYTDSGSQLRTGRAGRRLTTFPPQYEGDAYFVERIAVALPGSRGAYVSSGAQDGQEPSEFLRMQIARPVPDGGTAQEVVYIDNVGELYDAESSSTRQIAALTQWASNVLAEEVHLVLRNRDGSTSVTNLGPEEGQPARQFHLLRAGGRIVVAKVEEPGTIEIFRIPG
jgi:hypothetical protein